MLKCGKHRGRSYEEVAALDRGYCAWVLSDGANGPSFRDFARFLRREHGGVLRVGQHKGKFFNDMWANERDYCYWAVSLDAPGEPMKAFSAFAHAKVAEEEENSSEQPDCKRPRSQSFKCQICCDATVRSVLVPCGHMMCMDCAAKIQGNKCPFCRRDMQQVVKTFIC